MVKFFKVGGRIRAKGFMLPLGFRGVSRDWVQNIKMAATMMQSKPSPFLHASQFT